MSESSPNVAQLLAAISDGDDSAADELFPLVYEELHRLASGYMKRERGNHTLQATALIHEAYLRLVRSEELQDGDAIEYENVDHFMATAAVIMRRILVNHAKAKNAQKRGGGKPPLQIEEIAEVFDQRAVDIVALDEAMKELRELDETQHRLVEMRFFGGLTVKQCADLLGLSERAVYYEWSHARAWLKSTMELEA